MKVLFFLSTIVLLSIVSGCSQSESKEKTEDIICPKDSSLFYLSKQTWSNYDNTRKEKEPNYYYLFYKNGKFHQLDKHSGSLQLTKSQYDDVVEENKWQVLNDSILKINQKQYKILYKTKQKLILSSINHFADTITLEKD